jgi:hypothetical protein
VRKHDRPAQLLVGMPDVQAEPEVRLYRLVELRALQALDQPDRLERRVRALAVDLVDRVPIPLAAGAPESTSTPIARAVPAMTFIASSTSRAFRPGIFVSAIERS